MDFLRRWSSRVVLALKGEGAPCPFCGRMGTEHRFSFHAGWACPCGAKGFGSPLIADLDEVADVLLQRLGIPGVAAEPSGPGGASELVLARPYDIPKVLSELARTLGAHGYEMRLNRARQARHWLHVLWARRWKE